MICFDQVTSTHSLLLAPHCTAGLHRRTAAPQHHLPFGTTDTSDSEMNAAMTMSLCHVDLASGHIQQAIPAGQMFAQGAFEGILELRKEKSRDAARSRRGKENYEFYELAKMLPLPPAITSQLDKASIIRLSISYLKLRDFCCHGDPPWSIAGSVPNKAIKSCPGRRRSIATVATEIFEMHQGTHILQSLDGFGFALANDGRFLYISETVSIYLGLSQVDMTGSCIFDYVHPEDHQELADEMGLAPPHRHNYPSPDGAGSDDGSSAPTTPRPTSPTIPDKGNLMNPAPEKGLHRCFCVRMKSTLTKRGVHVKSSGYRVVQILTRLRSQMSFSLPRKHPTPLLGCVGLAIALPPPTITELLLTTDMFVTRLSPDLNIIYCEPRLGDMMDLQADEMTNQSLYSFCHAEDLQKLRKSHTDLLQKGQVLTDYYRLMLAHGGWVWVQMCATVMCNVKNIEEQNIIAVNYVLSGSEYAGCVMNLSQMKKVKDIGQSDHSETDRGSLGQESPLSPPPESPHGGERGGFSDEEQRGQKRKHSSRLTDSAHDCEDGPSPYDITALYPQPLQAKLGMSEGSYNGQSYSERLSESRNSRRKMERPKKRKHSTNKPDPHEVTDGECMDDFLSCGSSDVDCSVVDCTVDCSDAPQRGASPEVATSERNVSVSPPGDSPMMHSPVAMTTSSATAVTGSGLWLSTSADGAHISTSTSTSVRELEEVMNKHLPGNMEHLRTSRADCSHPSQLLKHKSAIQWVGSQSQAGLEHLPATNLLRSFYTSRESVIRSTVYSHRTPQYYSDMQSSLLTPPGGSTSMGSDAYKDMVSPFVPTQMAVSKASVGSLAYNLMAAYPSNPINVSMASSLSDSYGLATPPSSVSPQDSYSNPFANQLLAETSSGRKYRQFCHEASGIPIKPQAYPLPAHATLPTYEHAKTPYSPSTGYYGNTFANYSHISSPAPAHYHESSKSRSTW